MIQAMKDEVEKFKARVQDFRTAGDAKRALAARRAKAAEKNYNVPAQITDEDRRKAGEEADRAQREMKSESNVSKADKDALKEIIDTGDEGPAKPFRKGGMVSKSSKSGSRRGDGCCTRGHTKGKMY
jgi:hypothetical protein